VSNKVTSLAVTTLENVIQLNDAPNAVERLITQIEKDDKALCQSQELSARIQLKTTARIAAGDPSIKLLAVQRLISSSVTRYKELIDARIASAKSLKPPYEKEGTQKSEHVGTETSGTSEEKKNLYLCEFRARKDYYSARSILYEEGQDDYAYEEGQNDYGYGGWDENGDNNMGDAVDACNKAINFITNPNIKGIEKVATAYLQAAHCYEDAATAQFERSEKSYLNGAGKAYEKIAEEQAKDSPSQAVVESYSQAVDYYKNAATAEADGNDTEVMYLYNAGDASEGLAEEQAKDSPSQAVVESYTQAVDYFKKAATAQADGNDTEADDTEADDWNDKEAIYLNSAGETFKKLAEMQAKDKHGPAVLDSYTQAADYYKNAATAEANGNDTEADYWNSAGFDYYNLAKEQAKDNPNPAVVEGYTQAVGYFKNAATAQASGKEKEAMYLNSAGNASRDLNKENNKGNPNKETVRSLEHAIFCYQHAASAVAENKSEEAIKWSKYGDDSMK